MPVQLSSHADITQALRKLNLSLDQARTTDAKKTADPELARALQQVLKDVSPAEMKRLQAAIGATAPASAPTSSAPAALQTAATVAQKLPTKDGGKAPRIDTNPPGVAVFLQKYADRRSDAGPVDRPLERVLVHAAKIDGILSSEPDVEKLIDKVMREDLRRQVFLLEGISKLYSKEYDDAVGTYTKAKELEDALGLLSATRSNLAYAEHVKAPADVMKHLKGEEADAKKALKRLLEDDWMPRTKGDHKGQIPALAKLVKDWGEAKWDDYGDDKKLARKEMARRLDDIAATKYDMHDLQGGLHELRRQLRWFPIFVESLNGLVQLSEEKNPIAAYRPLLKDDLAKSKYVQLPDAAREVEPIVISKSLYTALMKLTLDLGGLKDVGEPIEALEHAYLATGKAKKAGDARDQVTTLIGGSRLRDDVHENADKLYAEMRSNRLVEELRKQVKDG